MVLEKEKEGEVMYLQLQKKRAASYYHDNDFMHMIQPCEYLHAQCDLENV